MFNRKQTQIDNQSDIIKKLLDEKELLEKQLDEQKNFPYSWDELKRSFDEKTVAYLKKNVLDERAWKFARQQSLNELANSIRANSERELGRREGVMQGIYLTLTTGEGLATKEEAAAIKALKYKYTDKK